MEAYVHSAFSLDSCVVLASPVQAPIEQPTHLCRAANSRLIKRMISLCCVGRPLTAAESANEVFQKEPNRYWTILPFLLDPPSISKYMAVNCTNMKLGGDTFAGFNQQNHFSYFLGDFDTPDQPAHLEPGETFGMCVDTFGGYETFARYDHLIMYVLLVVE
jgi:hypothetical protein